ncbi:hypothetical protein H8K33_19035 [Undibacterium amnicola]|uniref:Uncharacterized protein n=1 Tax=Undibacterium amnicola TaxID=1834038 RepID=A0ABR6XVW0_9BURK|nr:hypothetical protein [Undibacterium amnicola]MBC3833609.1 hypothetical protein [Undibacterium amnicola]
MPVTEEKRSVIERFFSLVDIESETIYSIYPNKTCQREAMLAIVRLPQKCGAETKRSASGNALIFLVFKSRE